MHETNASGLDAYNCVEKRMVYISYNLFKLHLHEFFLSNALLKFNWLKLAMEINFSKID